MEASPDCKKEQKQCESEAEDGQEGHEVGSLNGKALPGKAANSKKYLLIDLVIIVAIQTYMPCRHIGSLQNLSWARKLDCNGIPLAPKIGLKRHRKRSHFRGRIPAPILGPDSGPLYELLLGPDSGTEMGAGIRPSNRTRFWSFFW